jgi:hypothetical protein
MDRLAGVKGKPMTAQTFHLSARVSSNAPVAVRAALERFVGPKSTIRPLSDGCEVEADLEGNSARDLNRALLTDLRRAEKRTRLRAEWTSGGWVERFFDYVPKGRHPVENPRPHNLSR